MLETLKRLVRGRRAHDLERQLDDARMEATALRRERDGLRGALRDERMEALKTMDRFSEALAKQQERVDGLFTRLGIVWAVFAELGMPAGEHGITLDDARAWLAEVRREAEQRGFEQENARWKISILERWPALPQNLGILQAIEQRVWAKAVAAAAAEVMDEDSWPELLRESSDYGLAKADMQVIADNVASLECE